MMMGKLGAKMVESVSKGDRMMIDKIECKGIKMMER